MGACLHGGVTLGAILLPAVALFQAGLVVLILAGGQRDLPRLALAGVLAGSAIQAAARAAGVPLHPFQGPTAVVEHVIVLGLCFALSQFPTPWGGPRGRRVATALLGTMLVGWSGVLWVSDISPPTDWRVLGVTEDNIQGYVHNGLLGLGGLVLFSHTLPQALRLPRGPLRTQTLLVAGGIGAGLGAVGMEQLRNFWTTYLVGFPPSYTWPRVHVEAMLAVAGVLVLVAAVRVGRAAWQGRDREVGLVAVALVVGTLPPLHSILTFTSLPPVVRFPADFFSYALRPLLLGAALLRFDLVRVPLGLRRVMFPALAMLFAFVAFVMVAQTLTRGDAFGAETLDPLAVSVGVVVLAGLAYVARDPLVEAMRLNAPRGLEEAREHLRTYRLALERARRSQEPTEGPGFERLRRSLGITRQQHEVLNSVLDGHLVIPERALVGAVEGSLLHGRYEVLRVLGEGGQGRALLARDRQSGNQVVLKEVLRPWEAGSSARRQALRAEAGAAARVASPHLARVLDLVEDEWQCYLVREHIRGETLSERIARDGPMDEDTALQVMQGVASGLEALHRAGLVHGDLKPANVIQRPDGTVVLIDQGSTLPPAPGHEDVERTMARTAEPAGALTLAWAAPEMLDAAPPGPRTDVHQAGSLLYFLLTGVRPLAGDDAFELRASLRDRRPVAWPQGVRPSEPVRSLVARLRAPGPAQRPADGAELRRLLSTWRPGPAEGPEPVQA